MNYLPLFGAMNGRNNSNVCTRIEKMLFGVCKYVYCWNSLHKEYIRCQMSFLLSFSPLLFSILLFRCYRNVNKNKLSKKESPCGICTSWWSEKILIGGDSCKANLFSIVPDIFCRIKIWDRQHVKILRIHFHRFQGIFKIIFYMFQFNSRLLHIKVCFGSQSALDHC